MLSVHKGHLAPLFLGLGQDMQGQGSLTGGFRTVDLDDASLGNAANAQRHIQGQGARGDRLHIGLGVIAVAHDRALAVQLLYLLHGGLNSFFLVGIARRRGGRRVFLCCHDPILLRHNFIINTSFRLISLAEFPSADVKTPIIFPRDMCVGKNTSQAASVEF